MSLALDVLDLGVAAEFLEFLVEQFDGLVQVKCVRRADDDMEFAF